MKRGIENPAFRVLTGLAIVATINSACALFSGSEPQKAPDRLKSWADVIPEPNPKPSDMTGITLGMKFAPGDIRSLMTSWYSRDWRENLPDDTSLYIVDHGEEYDSGIVMAENGVVLRVLPDINSESVWGIKWLFYQESIPFRYEVIKKQREEVQEKWLV